VESNDEKGGHPCNISLKLFKIAFDRNRGSLDERDFMIKVIKKYK
jgi:hypothetical protein